MRRASGRGRRRGGGRSGLCRGRRRAGTCPADSARVVAIDILLTGATGFLGRHLAARLGGEHRVFRLNRQATGEAGEIVHDLSEPLPVDLLPRRIDAIIHTAGLVGQFGNASQPYQRVNVDATRELASYAVTAGATRFIFCSTGGVYQPTEQKLDEQSAVSPANAYTASKLAAETVLQGFDGAFAVQVLRLFFPFGPTQQGRLIPNLIERIAAGKPVSLVNAAGQPLITPLFIDDLVEYVRRVLELRNGFVANVAGDEVVSIRALAEMIGRTLGREALFEIDASAAKHNWLGANDLISSLTGYSPRVSLAAGLRRTMAREAVGDSGEAMES